MSNKGIYNYIIFDCYNIFYKASYLAEKEGQTTIKDISTKELIHTEGIVKFFQMINSYIIRFGTNDVKCIFLMDNAKTSLTRYRKALSEEYKKKRQLQPQWFYRELDLIQLILTNYIDNGELYRIQFLEADDYCSPLIRDKVTENDKVLMISDDMDWCRNLSDNVHQYKNKEIWTKEVFFEKMNFEASYSNICFYKTFYGDDSDNIIGALSNLPKQFFKDIISKFDNPNDFLAHVSSLDYLDLGWRMKIEKEENNILLNWNLVENADISSTQLSSYSQKCQFRKNKLSIIYASLNIVGKFDDRIKLESNEGDIFSMLNGEELKR